MDLKLVLALPLKWLRSEDGGVRADLTDANLTGSLLIMTLGLEI